MGLDSIVRSGVALADSITKPLQVTVRHKPWLSEDIYGNVTFGSFTNRKAVVTKQIQEVRSQGIMVLTKAQILFVKPVPPNGAPKRKEPVDPRDVIILPDGSTGPLISADKEGVADPVTSQPYFNEIFLGVT